MRRPAARAVPQIRPDRPHERGALSLRRSRCCHRCRFPAPALAVLPGEMLSDPALEARARALSAELRCMVCQNQSIDDSDADLAHDLRVLVRDRISAGDSDEQVIDFVVSRYGEFVLLSRVSACAMRCFGRTPILLLLAGGVFDPDRARRRGPRRRRSRRTRSRRLTRFCATVELRGRQLINSPPDILACSTVTRGAC